MNEVRSFVEAGLKDVSISRKTIKWGIPWPGDPEQVFYVWYDALTSYMTGIGYAQRGPEEKQKKFERFWPADLHMIGKEIIRFHAVYWPAFLMAAELAAAEADLRARLALFEQEKMSKSKGNVAYPEPIVKVARATTRPALLPAARNRLRPGRQFLPRGVDHALQRGPGERLGNLASRVLTMIGNYFGEIPPNPTAHLSYAELAAPTP